MMTLVIHNMRATLTGISSRIIAIEDSLASLEYVASDTFDEDEWAEIAACRNDIASARERLLLVIKNIPLWEKEEMRE